MKGKFRERVTPLMISAIRMAWASLSITHGPDQEQIPGTDVNALDLERNTHV